MISQGLLAEQNGFVELFGKQRTSFFVSKGNMVKQYNKTKFEIIMVIAFLSIFIGKALIVHAGTASLSWNANSEGDLAGYKIYYGTAPGSYGVPINVGKQTSYTITGLSNNTYYFAVTAYDTSMNESGFSSEVPFEVLNSDVSPPVLSDMAVGDISSTEATITWSTDKNATSRVEYGITSSYGSFSQTNTVLTASHNRPLSNLAPSTTYNYRVISIDVAGNTAISGNFTFTTASAVDTIAPALSAITSSSVSSTSAIITWSTNEGATSRVEYGATTSYGSFSQTSITFTSRHGRSLDDLAPSTTYNYRVISADTAGNIAKSGNFTFTTTAAFDSQSLINNLAVASGKPYEVIQNGLSNGALAYIDRTYTFGSIPAFLDGATYIKTANEDSVSSDSAFLRFDASEDVTIYIAHDDRISVKPSWLSAFVDTGDDILEDWRVHSLFKKTFSAGPVSLGGNGEIDWRMYVVIIDAAETGSTDTSPPVLSNINVSNITQSGAVVTWNTNEGATSKVNFGLTTGYGASSQLGTSLVTSHRRVLFNLSPSTTYHYRVISTDVAGNKVISGNFIFSTASNPDVTSPLISLISATNVTANSARISWGSDEPATSQVEFGLTSAYGKTTTLNQTLSMSHQQTLIQLQPDTLYHYRVKSIDAIGNISVSNDMTFLSAEGNGTNAAPPEEVLNFTALGKNRQIVLSWENPLDFDFAGVRILYRTDRFPVDVNDGELLGDYSGNPGEPMVATHLGMKNGITYYYLAASYDGDGNFESTTFVSAISGFQSTGDRSDEGSSTAGGGGCGMIRPGGGSPPGPGQAAEMMAMLGFFFFIWAKKGLKYYKFDASSEKIAH